MTRSKSAQLRYRQAGDVTGSIVSLIANHVDVRLIAAWYWQTMMHWLDESAGLCRDGIKFWGSDRSWVTGTPALAHS
jgi:hypothetical protein